MAQKTIANTERFGWDVSWDESPLGFSESVDPNIKMMLDPIMVGQVGKAKVGSRFVGLEGTITVVCQEPTFPLMLLSLPWNTGSPTTLVLAPPINTDMYTLAQPLRLHPSDVPVATVARDSVISFAVPTEIIKIKTDGKKDVTMQITFEFYPDRGSNGLAHDPPVLLYGTVGV